MLHISSLIEDEISVLPHRHLVVDHWDVAVGLGQPLENTTRCMDTAETLVLSNLQVE